MIRTLVLSIDSFSLELGDRVHSQFDENGYERITAETGNVEYSLFGRAIEDGHLYEPKHVWTISAYLDEQRWRSLWAIYQRAERKRRNQQSYSIVLDDYIGLYVEDSNTRTRALAPNGTVLAENGLIAYTARFAVRLFEPKARETRSLRYRYLASFVLRELDQLPA